MDLRNPVVFIRAAASAVTWTSLRASCSLLPLPLPPTKQNAVYEVNCAWCCSVCGRRLRSDVPPPRHLPYSRYLSSHQSVKQHMRLISLQDASSLLTSKPNTSRSHLRASIDQLTTGPTFSQANTLTFASKFMHQRTAPRRSVCHLMRNSHSPLPKEMESHNL
jgi:hypothetical protein